MKELKITAYSLKDLEEVSARLLEFSGDLRVLAFTGPMGSGKTTFIKVACKLLGVQESMNSPTFSLMNEYHSNDGNPVYHFDFYRIKNPAEAVDIGCEEYFYSGRYCFVEWSEKILNLLPKETVQVSIEVENETRLITFRYG